MILYNLRYNGPFEYDKTVLNILQFYNEVNHLQNKELKKEKDTIKSLYDEYLKLYNDIKNKDSENIFKLLKGKGW